MKYVFKRIVVILISTLIWGCSTAPKPAPSPEPVEPVQQERYLERGKATFYANLHQSKKTANGEIYDHNRYTAAHRTLPFGTKLRVTNVKNGKTVEVTVNDRGPYIKGRILDLSRSAFNRIADTSKGVIQVEIEVIE